MVAEGFGQVQVKQAPNRKMEVHLGFLGRTLAIVGILFGFHVNSGEASPPMGYLEFRVCVVEELPQGCGQFVSTAPGCAKET